MRSWIPCHLQRHTMSLLLFLYHFAFTKALPLTDVPIESLSSRSSPSCDDINECRKLIDIIWSCLTTIFACTWLTLHPNIPPPPPTEPMKFLSKCLYVTKRFLRHRLLPFVVTLLLPEWVLAWAMQQRLVANQISKEGGTSTRSYYAVSPLKRDIGKGWTRTHGFFIIMGGFHAYTHDDSEGQELDPGTPWYPLDQETVLRKYRYGEIELPLEGEIQDKSKTDWLAKTLVLLHTGWFMIQCIARGVAHLPLSELEVVTLAYTIINVGIYIAWWDKPRNVDRPIRVFLYPYEVGKARGDKSSKGGWVDTLASRLRALLPGAYDINLHAYSSVPTFYSGKINKRQDLFPSMYVPSAVGIVFGAIHFIAWSYSFPSHTEQLLWRISSVAMVGVPVWILVGTGSLILFVWLDGREDEPSILKIYSGLVNIVLFFLIFVVFILCRLLYVFARVTTFILAFKTLSSLPVAVFQTIPWTKWIPHI
jgi:hypothetical protein